MKANIYVKTVKDSTVVRAIPVELPMSERRQEMLVGGLLRNMHDDYFVDDSEIDEARKKNWKE